MQEDLRPKGDYDYSMKMGVFLGTIVGGVIGAAMIWYVDSPALNAWPLAASIPIFNALGWALFGMIVGSGGLLARLRFDPHTKQHVLRMLHLAQKTGH